MDFVQNSKYIEIINNVDTEKFVSFEGANKPTIQVENSNITTAPYSITVQSTFAMANTTGKQERTVQTNYSIVQPDYQGSYYIETNSQTVDKNVVFQKAIAIDGNMKLNGNVTVTGDVFVKGNEVSNSLGTKYNGGVIIQGIGGDNININGTLSTNETVSIQNTQNVNVQDVYARNLFIQNSIINSANTLVLDNDLTINSNDPVTVNTQNFYGINDITEDNKTNKDTDNRARVSSSIIINATDPHLTMNVSGETYIMGTAYIKTDPSYQTGESIAIKGNYRAYTNSLNPADITDDSDKTKLSSDNAIFNYYNPLQVVDKYKDATTGAEENLTGLDKGKYFYYYNQKNPNDIKKANINLNESKTHIAGAYIRTSEVKQGNYTPDAVNIATINEKQTQYATNVYNMGKNGTLVDYTSKVVNNYVGNQVKFDSLTNTNKFDGNDVIVLNNDPNKTVVFRGDDYNNFDSEYPSTNSNYIIVDVRNTGSTNPKNGIVITKGNVEFVGVFNFTGTVIAVGNLEATKGSNLKNITYDSTVVQNLMAKNYDLFKDLFDTSGNVSNQTEEISNVINIDANVNSAIDGKKYVKTNLWKIIK